MQLVGLARFVSSDKHHSFGGIPWGIPNPAGIPSTFFYIGGPHPPEHGYQWVNDACQLNLFALPACHQRHGELKLLYFFFKNDHDKPSPQLALRFQRHRCSPELDECQMGRRRRCCGRFVFGKCAVSQESYPLGIKSVVFISVGCRSSVESCHSRHTEHPPRVTSVLNRSTIYAKM